ncbi:MAG: hypothetical protein ABJC74_13670 [Gemmatimonadota bacterium]
MLKTDFRPIALLAAALLAGCGGDGPTGPGGGSGSTPTVWSLAFGEAQGDGADCRFPSRTLTLTETAGSLAGSIDGTGDGICLIGDVVFSGAGPSGTLTGSVTGTEYTITPSIPQFSLAATRHGDSLVGTLAWTLNLIGSGHAAHLVGSWRAARLPDNAPATTTEFLLVQPDLTDIPEGDSVHLTVVAENSHKVVLSQLPTLTFTVSDPSRASVSATGWLKGSVSPGPFAIGVHGGQGYSEVVGHTITRAHSLQIQPMALVMNRTHGAQLTVTALDHDGHHLPANAVTYSSSNSAIATVSTDGRVAGPGPLGQAWIRVSSGALTDSIPVTIVAIPVSFALSPAYVVLVPGDTLRLHPEILDSAGLAIGDTTLVHFTSSQPSIATISGSGLVRSAGPLGFTDITASWGSVSHSVRILARSAAIPHIVATTQLGGSPAGVAVAASGAMYVGDANSGTLYRGDLPATALPSQQATGGSITSIAFNPAGTRAYAVHDSINGVLVIDPATNSIVDTIRLPENLQTLSVGVSPNGQKLIIGAANQVFIYDAATLDSLGSVTVGAGVVHLSFHPSLPLVYASANGVFEINYTTGQLVRTFDALETQASGTAVSADGSELYLASIAGPLQIYDLGSGALKEQVPWFTPGYSVAYSAAQDLLYLTLPGGGGITIVDRVSQVPVAIILNGAPRLVTLNAAGTTAVVTNENGWVDFIQ